MSLRAVCAGKRVFFGQFLKGMETSELKAMQYLPNFTIKQYGDDYFIRNDPTIKEKKKAEDALSEIYSVIISKNYDIIVLDEICVAVDLNVLDEEKVIYILNKKPVELELILTGRNATKRIIEKANLVTHMQEIKHYYNDGVPSRKGIEE